MAILTVSDFDNGRYKVPTNNSTEIDLMQTITFVEDCYLPKLLGVELYDLFIIDLAAPIAGEPTDPRFVKIYNAFNYQNTGGCNTIVQSKGIKEMLKAFVYYLYTRDIQSRITTVGIKQTDSDNSTNFSAIMHDITSRYNDGVKTYQSIQYYICENTEFDYPEFEGIHEPFNHPY